MRLEWFWRGIQILCFWGAALSIVVLFGPELLRWILEVGVIRRLLQLVADAAGVSPFSPGPSFKFPEPDSPVWSRADRIASYTLGATVLFGIIATIFDYRADRRDQGNGPGEGTASDAKALNGAEDMSEGPDEAEKVPPEAPDAEDDHRAPKA